MNAQTIISIESPADSTVVMKIQSRVLMENPQKLILIIDNTMMAYQLSEEEIYALLDSKQNNSNSSVLNYPDAEKINIGEQDDDLMDYLVDKTLNEENEAEELMEIEDWMYSPESWLSDKVK